MRQARWLAVGLLATLAFACGVWVMGCPAGAACLTAPGAMVSSFSLAVTASLVLIVLVLSWALRAMWLYRQSSREVGRLLRMPLPSALSAAIARTRIRHVECIEGSSLQAFCAGVLHPTVFMTPALIDRLDASQLDAVLLHERYHAERREPLRRDLVKAASDVFFFIPLLRWWAERRLEESELAADRAAIGQVGRRTVARALWHAGVREPRGLPAFGGAIEARVAQILGEHVASRPPALSIWLSSAAGSILVMSTAVCLAHVLLAVS